MIADQALAALGVEPRAVEGDDAGRLLAAMLKGVQPERDDRRGVRMAEDAEHAAFLVQPVFVEIDAGSAVFRERGRRCARGVEGRVLNRAIIVLEPARTAPAGTFLLMSASSFCLSRVELLDAVVGSDFFGAAGARGEAGAAALVVCGAADLSTGSSLVGVRSRAT